MKNKYHDVLVAWAEGRPIQYRKSKQPSWVTVETEQLEQLNLSSYNPYNQELEWRVKPDLPWYRVALLSQGGTDFFVGVVDNDACEKDIGKTDWFVRWLTDRISYEV